MRSRKLRTRLKGKVVVITGSSKGIGRETARLLHSLGARVVLNGRDPSRLAAVAGELGSVEGPVRSIAADVADPAEASRLIDETVEAYGRIDMLVNNAGLSMRGRFDSLSAEVVDRVMNTNINGTLYPTLSAVPHLTKNRGSVVFVSSLAGLRGFPGIGVYSASKMALTAIQQSLDAELRQAGVHAGVIHVGFTENDPDKTVLSGDGTPTRLERPYSQKQIDVAKAIVKCLALRQRRVVLTLTGKLLDVMVHIAPWVVSTVLRRSVGRIHKMS
jgi:NAD(P)-dependent dehydrogenase (short-subunit alcohol dehydrogenase family)